MCGAVGLVACGDGITERFFAQPPNRCCRCLYIRRRPKQLRLLRVNVVVEKSKQGQGVLETR